MTGKTHVACSTLAMGVFAVAHSLTYQFCGVDILPWVGAVAVPVGALLPDVDIQQSRLGQKFKFLSKNMKHRGITHTLLAPAILLLGTLAVHNRTTSIVASLLVGWLMCMLFNKKMKWRKGHMTDNIQKMATCQAGSVATVIMLVTSLINPMTGASILWGLMCGWTLHIFEDLFNSKGCPILFPLTKSHVRMPVVHFFKTRHWTEGLFFGLWTGVCLIWLIVVIKMKF